MRRSGGLDGRIQLRLTCITPAHVGSGLTGLEGGRAILLTARHADTPFIPGSSVKGALRTVAESLARSCPDQRCRACYPCLLFGAVAHQGRTSFGPAMPVASPPPRPLGFMLPRRTSRGPTWDEEQIRLYEHRRAQPDPQGAELIETLPAGTVLESRLFYRGLERPEIGFLLLVTGGAPGHGFLHKMGGGRGQGLGSVKVEIVEHKVRTYGGAAPGVGEADPPAGAGDLVREFLEVEQAPDPLGRLGETLRVLREKSRPLEVELP
jgi:hypothetical protein